LSNFEQLRKSFQSKSKEERIDLLKSLNRDELYFFYQNPDLFLFDKQIIPDTTDWRYCLLQCGRGFGKSYAGSAWLAKKIRQGAKLVALCAPTYFDVQEIQMPALLSWFLPDEIVGYSSKDHVITFTNGARCLCLSSEKDNVGTNLEYLWCDEIGNFCDQISDKIDLRYGNIIRGVRAGEFPQIIITSTPKSQKFFWDFQEKIDKNSKFHKIIRGTMFDNPFLPKSFVDAELDRVKDSPNKARQEVYGELITENPEAMFRSTWINENRFVNPDPAYNPNKDHDLDIKYFFHKVMINKEINIKEMIISVDTAGSSKKTSDETGIMLVAHAFNNDAYLLYDMSGHHTADEWAKIVRNLFYTYNKEFPVRIVAETNFGGETVLTNITALDHNLIPFVEGITASKSKMIRAEVSAAKYQRGKVHHVGYFEQLERQMCNYTGPNSNYSPDRMDALVHALNKLYVAPNADRKVPSFLNGY
jgi:phage terminase large subunit-like protein